MPYNLRQLSVASTAQSHLVDLTPQSLLSQLYRDAPRCQGVFTTATREGGDSAQEPR